MNSFKKAIAIVIVLFVSFSFPTNKCRAQTNSKYQSQVKSSEALYKIESAYAGNAGMSGYYSAALQVYLRKWTNLANNSKRFDIELRHDVSCCIEKGDWQYVLNSLKYILDALTNNLQENTEYSFQTAGGIIFLTKGKEVLVKLPGDNNNHKLTLESLANFIKALDTAISLAK